ncbi:MAG: translation initiation factor IF-2, partial [Puniceicoccaceae bacterium]
APPPAGAPRTAPPPAPPSAGTGGATPEAETSPADPAALRPLPAKPPIIVRDFAGLLGLKPFQLLSDLMDRGIFASMNQTVEEDVASKIAEAHGFRLEIRHRGGAAEPGDSRKKEEEEDESAALEPRPPVVCILGHVDHGKTTLLDTIRKTKIAEGEVGGITQHIGAYQVDCGGEKISFLDTPGHAAFARIRERGASTTDIAVLVVAADDGFKPQTDEALLFAKKAQSSLIVAINKIDTKGANIDRVKQQMQERGIPPEDLGGEVITVPVSALKGEGIDQLLEMIRLQAEIMELKAVATGRASGVIIESRIEQGRGPTATVLVQKGLLKVGDSIVCGTCSCKVKAMHDDSGRTVKQAPPSTPVKVIGWSEAPRSGAAFRTVKNEREAKRIAGETLDERRKEEEARRMEARSGGSSLDDLFSAIESTRKTSFRVILKADAHGSLEALEEMLGELPTDKIELEIVGRNVGMVTKKDIELADAADATVVGFNVKLETGVQGHAKHLQVDILQDSIIYRLIDLVRDSMADLLEPELREKKIGVAEVRAVFPLGKGFVAGCMVTEGRIQRDANTRLLRKGEIVHEGRIATLKRFKDDANEVRAGFECGIGVGGFNGYEEGDSIECFEVEKIRPTL